MALPEVQINIQDPGLGTVPASAGRTQVKLGVATKAVPNALLSLGSIQAARDALGSGPLLEAVAQVLRKAGGPVLAMPLLPSVAGTIPASLTLTGVGVGTIALADGPGQVVRVKIITGGTPGTMTYQTALGAGSAGYGPTITSTVDPYSARVVGQQFTNLVFGNVTYVANDVYTINANGTITRTGSGPATALDGSVHSPADRYDLWVEIMTTGALGAAQFRYSLDGGNTWGANLVVPSGGVYVIPDTGLVMTFAGASFTAGDVYKATVTPPGFVNQDLVDGLTALLANPTAFGFLHVVGHAADAAAALTLATTVQTYVDAFEVAFRYIHGIIEGAHDAADVAKDDTAYQTQFLNFVSDRVSVVPADMGLQSALTGRVERRPIAWRYATRLSEVSRLAVHPGKVEESEGGGALSGVVSLYRNEDKTPGLDAARFVTARTIEGVNGYFITRGQMMAAPGSDFLPVMRRRVMDRACEIARAGFVLYLNKDLRIGDDGFIDERDAQEIEAIVGAKLRAAIVDEGEASSSDVVLSRTDNLLSTSTLNAEIHIVPLGYTETIKVAIGFKNPLLGAA